MFPCTFYHVHRIVKLFGTGYIALILIVASVYYQVLTVQYLETTNVPCWDQTKPQYLQYNYLVSVPRTRHQQGVYQVSHIIYIYSCFHEISVTWMLVLSLTNAGGTKKSTSRALTRTESR